MKDVRYTGVMLFSLLVGLCAGSGCGPSADELEQDRRDAMRRGDRLLGHLNRQIAEVGSSDGELRKSQAEQFVRVHPSVGRARWRDTLIHAGTNVNTGMLLFKILETADDRVVRSDALYCLQEILRVDLQLKADAKLTDTEIEFLSEQLRREIVTAVKRADVQD